MQFELETDHKPLVPLLETKHLDSLPPQVLRFCLRLRLARFKYSISHEPGKLLYTPDTLSRAPSSTTENDTRLQEAEALMEMRISNLPASTERLTEYQRSQAKDPVCSSVIAYCQRGWSGKRNIETSVPPYWKVRGELTSTETTSCSTPRG